MKSKISVACFFLLTAFFAFSQNSDGMIRTLPLPEMISQAEYIVIAEVHQITKAGYLPNNKFVVLRNELKVIESLKGTLKPDESILINTIKGERWIEDNVELPLPGSRVFLFLKKDRKGEIFPVNGIQGVWPMKGNELLGMGTGKDLSGLREMIYKSLSRPIYAP